MSSTDVLKRMNYHCLDFYDLSLRQELTKANGSFIAALDPHQDILNQVHSKILGGECLEHCLLIHHKLLYDKCVVLIYKTRANRRSCVQQQAVLEKPNVLATFLFFCKKRPQRSGRRNQDIFFFLFRFVRALNANLKLLLHSDHAKSREFSLRSIALFLLS